MEDNIRLSSIEMIEKHLYINEDGAYKDVHDSVSNVADCMIKFAKYHVEQALKEAYKNNVIKTTTKQYEGVTVEIKNVVESSIINAYPLENIK